MIISSMSSDCRKYWQEFMEHATPGEMDDLQDRGVAFETLFSLGWQAHEYFQLGLGGGNVPLTIAQFGKSLGEGT